MSESSIWVKPATEANRVKVVTEKIGTLEYPVYLLAHLEDGEPVITSHANALPTTDPWLHHAEHVIENDFGDKVSVYQKSKDLLKFGRNELVGTTEATIQHQPAGVFHETYVTDNLINSIISTSAADTQEVVVEMHTISAGVFTFFTQTVNLNGRTAVPLTPGARVSRTYNNDTTEMVGVISVTETDTYTNGVPATDSKIHLQLGAGEQNSEKCSTTISNTDYWIVTNFYADVLSKTAAYAEIHLEMRLTGKVFREVIMKSASDSHAAIHKFEPYLIVPKNADIRISAVADGSNTDISAGIQGVLAVVI